MSWRINCILQGSDVKGIAFKLRRSVRFASRLEMQKLTRLRLCTGVHVLLNVETKWFIKYRPQREKTYFLTCAPNEDSNQPAHLRSLIRVFVFRMKKLCILGYPKSAHWRFWSDCANVQADLNLRWAHRSDGTFPDDAIQIYSPDRLAWLTHSFFKYPFLS